MSYDSWLTTTPEDKAHIPECNCPECHESHIEYNQVFENALESPQDFKCCLELLEEWEYKKGICRNHYVVHELIENAYQCPECYAEKKD